MIFQLFGDFAHQFKIQKLRVICLTQHSLNCKIFKAMFLKPNSETHVTVSTYERMGSYLERCLKSTAHDVIIGASFCQKTQMHSKD